MRIGRPAGFSVRKRWMSRLRKRRSYGKPCAAPVLSGNIEVLMDPQLMADGRMEFRMERALLWVRRKSKRISGTGVL